jgi:hypothetical protein
MKARLAARGAVTLTPGHVLRPVVGLDIDGTLGYYHEHFASYASDFLQKYFDVSKWDGSVPFWKLFGVSKSRYREMKLGYRLGRMKRSMEAHVYAAELTRAVRATGAEVWVCTTRPYLSLDNIEPDTRWWLRQNGIQFDGMLFGPNKYRDLAKAVGRDRVVAVLDDEPENIVRASSVGLSAFLLDRLYNRNEDVGWRLGSLGFARGVFVDRCNQWKEQQGV